MRHLVCHLVKFILNNNFLFKIWCVNKIKNIKPDAGLEPATVGLKVQRSTDWANQARGDLLTKNFINFSSYVFGFVSFKQKYCNDAMTIYNKTRINSRVTLEHDPFQLVKRHDWSALSSCGDAHDCSWNLNQKMHFYLFNPFFGFMIMFYTMLKFLMTSYIIWLIWLRNMIYLIYFKLWNVYK